MRIFSNAKSIAVFFFFFIIVSISCGENDKRIIEQSAATFDIKQAEASILQSNQNFMKSFKAGDSLGVANCFTTDAKTMAAHMSSTKSRSDIIHNISESMKNGFKDINLSTIKIWGDSNIVAEEGTYNISDSLGKRIDKGKYIVLWKTEAGNWKMFRDIWNSDLPDTVFSAKKSIVKNKLK